MLTKKQRELLLFINQRLSATGISPSFDEMKDALNLKSKSGIHRLISGLEERSFIRRLPHRTRALEGVKLPRDSAAAAVARAGPLPPGERPRHFCGPARRLDRPRRGQQELRDAHLRARPGQRSGPAGRLAAALLSAARKAPREGGMLGLMADRPLLISTILTHAAAWHGETEIVSRD